MDLTRDFFFSYSYHVMHCLQKNLYNNKIGKAHYETMFVWNEFLTQGIRNNLKNTLWTVALVYGFFKQVHLILTHSMYLNAYKYYMHEKSSGSVSFLKWEIEMVLIFNI